MPQCAACGKFLGAVGAATCSTCPAKYHKACLALPDKSQVSKDWICPSCKQSERKGDNSQTPIKGICDPVVTAKSPPIALASEARTSLPCLSPNEVTEFRRVFDECMNEMREFRNETLVLKELISALTERMDNMDRRLDGIEQRLSSIESRSPAEEAGGTRELERTVAALRRELNDRDQEALLADLDIGHVPEEKGENVTHSVTVLAAQLGITLDERDIVFAERVGAPPAEGGRARRIVVRLTRRHLRDEVLRAARVRRNVKSPQGGRVYINERLTRVNRLLFNQARSECRRLNWRYCWTKQGRIFARQSDGKPVFRLGSEEDLARIFGSISS